MKLHPLPVGALALLGLFLAGCDQRAGVSTEKPTPKQPEEEHSDEFAVAEDEVAAKEPVPKTLDEALDLLMKGITDEDKKLIEDAGEEYASTVHFGSGLGMRNSWGLWGDSPLSRYFARLGIYHADDMSGIISTAFSRRVRGKEIKLEELVQYYRDYWKDLDIIAPLDLKCPHCGEEMAIGYMGEGISKKHPERAYFFGRCPDSEEFVFYHKDGWQRSETVSSEQGDADQPATAPESTPEGNPDPGAETEKAEKASQ